MDLTLGAHGLGLIALHGSQISEDHHVVQRGPGKIHGTVSPDIQTYLDLPLLAICTPGPALVVRAPRLVGCRRIIRTALHPESIP